MTPVAGPTILPVEMKLGVFNQSSKNRLDVQVAELRIDGDKELLLTMMTLKADQQRVDGQLKGGQDNKHD